ncbi:proline-rich receptor-like protein kinase PERK2 [Alosa alosa]|uniref:proline-rich receptor-like protein kinase PERK2 n=1 Tax=Alosa alosa TaxID=278164 RepID=UPI00201516BA|nr:proline-rich receptor-like protein kinase PERK2 [Alosa alosa]
MVAFINKDRTVPYRGNLYQHDNSSARRTPVCDPTTPSGRAPSPVQSPSSSYPSPASPSDRRTPVCDPTTPSGRAPSPVQSTSSSSPSPASPSARRTPARVPTRPSGTLRARKRQRLEDGLLAYLERSDAADMAATQRLAQSHEQTLAEMRTEMREDRSALIQLFSRMVEKQ